MNNQSSAKEQIRPTLAKHKIQNTSVPNVCYIKELRSRSSLAIQASNLSCPKLPERCSVPFVEYKVVILGTVEKTKPKASANHKDQALTVPRRNSSEVDWNNYQHHDPYRVGSFPFFFGSKETPSESIPNSSESIITCRTAPAALTALKVLAMCLGFMLLANLADLSFREETTRQLKPSPKSSSTMEKMGWKLFELSQQQTTYPSPRNFMNHV